MVGWHGKTMRAHKLAYQLHNGIILPRERPHKSAILVMHSCDNRPCCNPAHLSLGTHLDNRLDCVAKGRDNAATGDRNGSRLHPELLTRGDANPSRSQPEKLKRGGEHPLAQLNETQVLEIRRRSALGEGNMSIAKDFGVRGAVIWKIKTRYTWRHI